VPGGGGDQGQPGDVGALLPVQLDDPLDRDAPALEVGADAERHQEGRVLAGGDAPDRAHVQVVVVVVRDHHGVQRRQ
jgi:hypothetical protein